MFYAARHGLGSEFAEAGDPEWAGLGIQGLGLALGGALFLPP